MATGVSSRRRTEINISFELTSPIISPVGSKMRGSGPLPVSATSRPLRRGESLDISPEDAERLALAPGEQVRVVSRRGQVEVPIRLDESLRPGLTFMTLHFQDDVATNLLTIDATDPKSGTAEFKATAVRIEKLEPVPAS